MKGQVKPFSPSHQPAQRLKVKLPVAHAAKNHAVRPKLARVAYGLLHDCKLAIVVGKVSPTGPDHDHDESAKLVNEPDRLPDNLARR